MTTGGAQDGPGPGRAPGRCAGRAGMIWIGLLLVSVLDLHGGCGKVGSPIPPEEVGVAAKLEQERRARAKQQRAPEATGPIAPEGAGPEDSPEGEPSLPPLRPLRSR